MRKKIRNPTSKESSGRREKAKRSLPDGALVSSTNLDRAGHFGPFHGSNRRRSGKQRITLDLNHFGFRGRGGQRGGENEEKKEAKGE